MFYRAFSLLFLLLSFFQPFCDGGSLKKIFDNQEVQNGIKAAKMPRYQIEIAAIFNNEERFMREWIEYYRLLGVEHFLLYNNRSDDDYLELLEPYIEVGLVELIEWHGSNEGRVNFETTQMAAYNDALERSDSTWLGIIDLDEFLVPKKEQNLPSFFAEYLINSTIAAVEIPWVMFGTSYVQEIPSDQLMIETLIMNAGELDRFVKVFVRPEFVKGCPSPHYCDYFTGKIAVRIDAEKGQLNHYWTRDERYLHGVKIPRRSYSADTGRDGCLSWAESYNRENPAYAESIQRFVPALRVLMGL